MGRSRNETSTEETTTQEAQTFEVVLNEDLDMEGYAFSEPILEADIEEGVVTEFRRRIPRPATEAEYKKLSEVKYDKKQVVKKA